MSKVKDTDRGYNALVKRVYGLKKPSLEVGIAAADGEKTHQDPEADRVVTVLQVAIWNEFGTSNIPARPFIRGWFDENRARARQMVRVMLEAVVAGKYQPRQALELLGQKFVAEIQLRMANRIPPPNAPSTVAKKGSDVPLIDTGQLRSSITYRVKE